MPSPNDPNGIAWLDWKKLGFSSYEAMIESKAGACPPEMPLGACPINRTGHHWVSSPKRPGERWCDWCGQGRDWPFAEPPPYPADDEGREVPDA